MSEISPSVEAHIASLISSYADRVPTDVDPAVMSRLVVNRPRPVVRARRTVMIAAAVAAMVVASLVGGMVAGGRPWLSGPFPPADEPLAPFVGLPPEGAASSMPESGVLAISAMGIHPWYSVNVYDDGRLIWARERSGSGAFDWTTGWREQRLTPSGVEFLRSGAISLGGQYADPGASLPSNAWEDPTIRAYVPSRFAACLWYLDQPERDESMILDLIPRPGQALLRAAGRAYDWSLGGPGRPAAMRCYDLPTLQARAFDAILSDAGFKPKVHFNEIHYDLARPSSMLDPFDEWSTGDPIVWLIPLLPHGEWQWAGG